MRLIQSLALGFVELFGNIGIALGMTFALVLLLRPVTNRLLRPRYRVAFWMMAWIMGWIWNIYHLAGTIRLLPVTFRGLIVPKGIENHRVPAFIPSLRVPPGEQVFTLPGGGQVPFTLTEGGQIIVALVVAASFALGVWWLSREEKKLRQLVNATPIMSDEWHRAHGVDPEVTCVRIGPGLPASFVCRMAPGIHSICLQTELPPGQMELVLRHELAHIRGRHVWFKGMLAVLIVVYWWNPVFWVAYRLTCRDIELACDEAVLNELDEAGRREYARTLVELGSGKHLWAGLTSFGECDAQVRVRQAVDWKREPEWMSALVWPALILAALFLFTAPRSDLVDRDAAWLNYVQGPNLVLDVRQFTQQPDAGVQEVWVRESDEAVLVLDSEGTWHLMGYRWYREDQKYRWSSHVQVQDPGFYEFRQVRAWTGEVLEG